MRPRRKSLAHGTACSLALVGSVLAFGASQVTSETSRSTSNSSTRFTEEGAKLAVGWLRLGIQIEGIAPGQPQQNGRHVRMHLTLKKEATRPAAANVLQQQARVDTFMARYNHDHPHQASAMKVPADVYVRSPRVYRGLQELTYPLHDHTIAVTRWGRICFNGRKVNLSHVFAGQNVWPSCRFVWNCEALTLRNHLQSGAAQASPSARTTGAV